MDEKLPLRPTPEQVAKAFRLDKPKELEEQQKAPRTPEAAAEKPVETFELPGFFDHVNMRKTRIGGQIYMVPSLRDIRTIHESVKRSQGGAGEDMLKWTDEKFNSDHEKSLENMIAWVERGIGELYEADRYFKAGQDANAQSSLESARRSFATAQIISKTMANRYFPSKESTE